MTGGPATRTPGEPAGPRRPEPVSLAGGVAVIVLGCAMLLDSLDVITLGFGWLTPLIVVTVGAVLLASGLAARSRRS
jgi:hypothetical protein